MIESIGLEHLFDLTATEKILAFFTPLIIFAAFAVAQMALSAVKVTGYVTNPETGEPRTYRLNGLLVFAIAVIIWATEVTGMPRDWFYRSSLWAVFGGTVFTVLFSLIAVFGQPQGEVKNPIIAFYLGRKQEFSFFNEYFDVKMWFYVVGGSMLALNALSGAVWHHENFADANLGVFLYAGIYAFYITDYFIWERVQLYTYDLIHENTGFKLFWGGLVVYGWLFILPLWAMAAQPDPGSRPLPSLRSWAARRHCSWPAGRSRAGPTCRNTGSSDGRSVSSYGLNQRSSWRASARSCAAASGALLAISTTSARACLGCRSPSVSATSTMFGRTPT